ncbi:MAG: hypothetical protein ACYCU8_03710 [Ferrimicrobium acidiphilum]
MTVGSGEEILKASELGTPRLEIQLSLAIAANSTAVGIGLAD